MTRIRLIVLVSALTLLAAGCTIPKPDSGERIVAPELTLAGGAGWIHDVAFSPRAPLLATVTSARPELRFFDIGAGRQDGVPVRTDLTDAYDMAFTPDGGTLLVCGEGFDGPAGGPRGAVGRGQPAAEAAVAAHRRRVRHCGGGQPVGQRDCHGGR
ncbi:hypothetical protein [Krasilnikovia sp. MM14-A1259]|uniref:hypothetical protein n=1 Tax=Krasilnikovia sp. MM14-A1259 TaxID=3373539 RepID=UPI00399CB916